VVHRGDLDRVTAHLDAHGYQVIRECLPTYIAFRDQSGREVDLHPVDPTPDGGGDQLLPDDKGTWRHYSSPIEGSIHGRPVRCAPGRAHASGLTRNRFSRQSGALSRASAAQRPAHIPRKAARTAQ
jgi:hypothetical protein